MLIHAYRVESRRASQAERIPLAPAPVGIVQFTGGIDRGRTEAERKRVAKDLLSYRSPLFDHRAYGKKTWRAELTSVDDDSLGKPSFEDASKGYRIWLLL
jgi:hypothetical protein